MLPAEITSTAAKPRMILARNLRVGNMVRLDGDAILPDIPTPNLMFLQRSRGPEAALSERVRKIKAETSRGGKSVRPAPRVERVSGPSRATSLTNPWGAVLRLTGKRLIL
ncbi:hypothetical protein BDS110ZK14_29610 [Bradyrhizobium diazoefficiens]|nr:hypothetical protein XF15B_03280 [Bradyrhizobium diazoefficiens]